MRIPAGRRVSFASYFNAFPASYWQHWSNVRSVRLSVTTTGTGTVLVFRSNSQGIQQRRRAIRAANKPEAEMDALFLQQQKEETAMLDLERVQKHRLRADHVSDGDDGELQAVGLARRRIEHRVQARAARVARLEDAVDVVRDDGHCGVLPERFDDPRRARREKTSGVVAVCAHDAILPPRCVSRAP